MDGGARARAALAVATVTGVVLDLLHAHPALIVATPLLLGVVGAVLVARAAVGPRTGLAFALIAPTGVPLGAVFC